MNYDTLRPRLREATEACLALARSEIAGAGRLPPVALRFDLRGQAAGQMRASSRGRLEIRFNLALARQNPDAFIAQTVPHEVAHLVVWHKHGRKARPHGPEWQAVMRQLGISHPSRCHVFEIPDGEVRRQRRWRYRCACHEFQLSTTRHNRIQRGEQTYSCRDCGEPLKLSPEQ